MSFTRTGNQCFCFQYGIDLTVNLIESLGNLEMYPRRTILPDNSLAHVVFRCHNRQNFFRDNVIKMNLLCLWAKYKEKYHIEIFDFIIMNNHAHLILRSKSAKYLGDFMRTVNSQIARIINKANEKDSQAIRQRYKSPVIESMRYLRRATQYVWLNRLRVNPSTKPLSDPFCSLSWRFDKAILAYFKRYTEEVVNLLDNLLDSLPEFYESGKKRRRKQVLDLFNEAAGLLNSFNPREFIGHTIGSSEEVARRTKLLKELRRTQPP